MEIILMNELIDLLNLALTMEHAAAIQYYTHAEQLRGNTSDPIIEVLREHAEEEQKHANMLRRLLGDFLLTTPAVEVAEVKRIDGSINSTLITNISSEKEAILIYKKLYSIVMGDRDNLTGCFFNLEKTIREISVDEEEHAAELERLL
jgi:bacterioferritin